VDLGVLGARGLEPLAVLEALLAAGPRLVQLRAKDLGPRDTLDLLRAMRGPCERAGVPLVANDRPDLALLAGLPAVHVGQEDLPVSQVRRLSSELLVGVSTHSLEQVKAALLERPDYVAFGPVFGTSSKARPDPVVGLEGLASAHALTSAAGIPLVAIGGLTLQHGAAVAPHAELLAVIADLFAEGTDAAAITRHAAALSRAMGA